MTLILSPSLLSTWSTFELLLRQFSSIPLCWLAFFLSLSWVFRCLLRWSLRPNALLQMLQRNDFSFVCILRWRWSSSDLVKLLPHWRRPVFWKKSKPLLETSKEEIDLISKRAWVKKWTMNTYTAKNWNSFQTLLLSYSTHINFLGQRKKNC